MAQSRLAPQVAILATGDEITNGDITDTNTPYFAQQLIAHGVSVGLHMTVHDDQANIETAIRYLLASHQAVITIGGLGPTVDDRTRFALADAVEQPLEFSEESWNRIVKRLESFALAIPESNRQQALFPKNAIRFANPNGTADACYVELADTQQMIFMMPGPPNETRKIFDSKVLPILSEKLSHPMYRYQWLLLNVSESDVAEKLESITEQIGCQLGFRVDYPYLEVKLVAESESVLQQAISEISPLIDSQSVSNHRETASAQLHRYLAATKNSLKIALVDTATMGLLTQQIIMPDTIHHFVPTNQADIKITISGLTAYWQQMEVLTTDLIMTIEHNKNTETIKQTLPYRKRRTQQLAAENASITLLSLLRADPSAPNLA